MEKLYKQTSVISKGGKVGNPVYTRGSPVRFLGIPVLEDGKIALNSTRLSFQGSFDGTDWFAVNTLAGKQLSISIAAQQTIIPGNGLKPSPVVLPIDPALFVGIQMIRPEGNYPETDDRSIDLYCFPD